MFSFMRRRNDSVIPPTPAPAPVAMLFPTTVNATYKAPRAPRLSSRPLPESLSPPQPRRFTPTGDEDYVVPGPGGSMLFAPKPHRPGDASIVHLRYVAQQEHATHHDSRARPTHQSALALTGIPIETMQAPQLQSQLEPRPQSRARQQSQPPPPSWPQAHHHHTPRPRATSTTAPPATGRPPLKSILKKPRQDPPQPESSPADDPPVRPSTRASRRSGSSPHSPLERSASSHAGTASTGGSRSSPVESRASSTRPTPKPILKKPKHPLPTETPIHEFLLEYNRDVRPNQHLIYFNLAPKIEIMNVRDHSLKSSPQLPPLELQRIPASALGPKFTHMVIRCERAPMWEIVADNERGLTCWDVFKALWDSFRTPLTDEELAILRSQPQHANKELDIRADVLGHCCIFIGLRVNANGDAWDLMLGKDADPKGLNIMRRRH